MKRVKVEVSIKFLIYSLLFFVAIVLAWQLKTILIMLFIAFILNAALRPAVDWLQDHKVPRSLSILIMYLGILIFVVVMILLTASEFAQQLVRLINALPSIYSRVVVGLQTTLPFISEILPLGQLGTQLNTFVETALRSELLANLLRGENVIELISRTLGVAGSVAGVLVGIVTIIIVSAYMLQRRVEFYEGILDLLPNDIDKSLRKLIQKIEASLGAWLGGQVILMLTVGIFTYFVILLPGVFDPTYTLDDFALPIAILAGLLEALPNIGPTVTLILAVMLALGTSTGATVIYIIITFLSIQQLEALIIVPTIMKHAVGIDPIMTILGILAGFTLGENLGGLGGVLGAILAIPVVAVIQIAIVEFAKEHKRLEKQRPKLVS